MCPHVRETALVGRDHSLEDQLAARTSGSPLPSERQLAAQLDAGRTTIRLILMKLATEGMIRSEHGRGYFVTGADNGDADSVSE